MINSDNIIMWCRVLSRKLSPSSNVERLWESSEKLTNSCTPPQLHTPCVLRNEQLKQTELTEMHPKCCKALQDQKKDGVCSSSMSKSITTKTPHSEIDIPSPVSVRDTAKLMEVAGLNTPLSRDSSGLNRRKRKKVQFESTSPPAYEAAVSSRSATTREEKAAFWYAKRELDEFRHHAKRLCKQAWDERSSDLERIVYPSNFSISSEAPASAWVHGPEIDDKAAQNLGQSRHFEVCRGLEHMTSQKLCLARSMTVLNAKTLLTLEQAQSNLLKDDIFDESKSEDHLANVYAAASLPAIQFARMMGQADAVAAREDLL